MRKLILALIVIVGMAAIGSLFVNRLHYSHLYLKSCFDDAGGLRAGAPVRISGVEIGTVRSVRANPQNKNCPAEVEMVLATTYDIRIPRDSIVETNTAGLMDEVYANIDITQASGEPIENYGYLKSKSSRATLPLADQLKAADILLRLARSFKEAEKEAPNDTATPTHP